MSRFKSCQRLPGWVCRSLTVLGIALAHSAAAQYSAFLPDRGGWVLSPSYTYQTFDHFWAGSRRLALSDLGLRGDLIQHTFQMVTEYGMTRRMSLDASVGYVQTRLPARNQHGLTDSTFGVRFQLLKERRVRPNQPTIAVRVGGIVEGTYDLHLGLPPTHPGDGASGVESAVLFGKRLGRTGLTAYGDFGIRERAEGVPTDLFGSAGLGYGPCPWLALNVAYRHEQSLSGVEILGTGFTGNWQVVREINRLLEVGITFLLPRTGVSWSTFVSWNLSGRNTPDKTVIGTYLSLGFGR